MILGKIHRPRDTMRRQPPLKPTWQETATAAVSVVCLWQQFQMSIYNDLQLWLTALNEYWQRFTTVAYSSKWVFKTIYNCGLWTLSNSNDFVLYSLARLQKSEIAVSLRLLRCKLLPSPTAWDLTQSWLVPLQRQLAVKQMGRTKSYQSRATKPGRQNSDMNFQMVTRDTHIQRERERERESRPNRGQNKNLPTSFQRDDIKAKQIYIDPSDLLVVSWSLVQGRDGLWFLITWPCIRIEHCAAFL